MLENDKRRVRRLHSFNYWGLKVGFSKGIDRLGEAKRGDRIDCKTSEAKIKVRRSTGCIIRLNDIAKAINLGCI